MDWGLFYGALALLTFGLSILSGSGGLQKIAFILLVSCGVSNVIYGAFTPPALCRWNALVDLMQLILVAGVFNCHPKTTLIKWPMVLSYIAMLTCHFAFLKWHSTFFTEYYLTLNVLFLFQLVIVSGWSIRHGWRRFGGLDMLGHIGHRGIHRARGAK